MISELMRRVRARRRVRADLAGDPSARFAYDLATKPPTKDVASVKAASAVYAANVGTPSPNDGIESSCRRTHESPERSN